MTGAQSLWRTWGERAALRIFQLKHEGVGVFIHLLPSSTAKSCFSGHLLWHFQLPAAVFGMCVSECWGIQMGSWRLCYNKYGENLPFSYIYPSSNDLNHSLGNQPHTVCDNLLAASDCTLHLTLPFLLLICISSPLRETISSVMDGSMMRLFTSDNVLPPAKQRSQLASLRVWLDWLPETESAQKPLHQEGE